MSAYDIGRAAELDALAQHPHDPRLDALARSALPPAVDDLPEADRGPYCAALVREQRRRKIWRDLSRGLV